MPRQMPYGSWKSPITSDVLVADKIRLSGLAVDGDDLYWRESRPAEGGRSIIVRRTPNGKSADVTPEPFNVRSRVHEYGGGAFAVSKGTVYFSNFNDQRLYRQDIGTSPRPITPEKPWRYADYVIDRGRRRLICVCEDHTQSGHEPINSLVEVDMDGSENPRELVSGNDFYSSPRLSPDATRLAWLTWNHPNMPWDGTELRTADILPDGSLANPVKMAGGIDESIFQPEWSPDGVLHFISDRTGWWNLYRLIGGRIEPLCEKEIEFGLPQWVFGMRTYFFESPDSLVCAYTKSGKWYLARLDAVSGELTTVDTPYTPTEGGYLDFWQNRVVFIGESPTESSAVVTCDLADGKVSIIKKSGKTGIDADYLSTPHAIEFPTTNDRTAHGFYYPPQNKDYTAAPDDYPPLIVKSHGGPTSAECDCLSLEIQFWTSRGFAVLDVNYGGSGGYGREYRRRLNGQWGIVDVDDCVNGARYLVEQGKADGQRLIIRGGSAGGYTTLCALTFHDTFRAGCSRYGIGDLETLAKDTHKFESRYMDSLVGPYQEMRELYHDRSPIHFAHRLDSPIIFFQGLEDKVVPPQQTEKMVNALKNKKLPVAYIAFEGEQHGFRRAENITRALDAELYFYARVFGFELADRIDPVPIDNL